MKEPSNSRGMKAAKVFWIIALSILAVVIIAIVAAPSDNNDDKSDTDYSAISDNMSSIEKIVRQRSNDQYEATTVDKVIFYDETEDDAENYTVMAYLTFNRANSPDVARPVVKMYSNDLAAWLTQEDNTVDKVYVYWTLPNLTENRTNTSTPYFIYDRSGNGMAVSDENWPF